MKPLNPSQFAMSFSKLQSFQRSQFAPRGTIPSTFLPNAPLIYRHICYRNYINMNSIILIIGQVRTGKSSLMLKLAYMYMKIKGLDYGVDKQFSFDVLPFLEWSRGATDGVFALDEVSKSLPPTEWYSVQNKIFRNFIDTQGFRRNVLIMTLPNLKGLYSRILANVNYVIITRNQGKATVYKQFVNQLKGKMGYMGLENLKWKLPPKEIWDRYEHLKKEWNDKILDEDINELKHGIKKKENRNQYNFDPQEYPDPILKLPVPIRPKRVD